MPGSSVAWPSGASRCCTLRAPARTRDRAEESIPALDRRQHRRCAQLQRLGFDRLGQYVATWHARTNYRMTRAVPSFHGACLAYRKEATVNWDPIDQTCCNEQVDTQAAPGASGAKCENGSCANGACAITGLRRALLDTSTARWLPSVAHDQPTGSTLVAPAGTSRISWPRWNDPTAAANEPSSLFTPAPTHLWWSYLCWLRTSAWGRPPPTEQRLTWSLL